MIRELRIRDLSVVAEAVVELGPGLTVLTGETGAGKTMIVSALALLFGSRADPGLVRTGAAKAVVEAVLEIPTEHPVADRVREAGGEVDGELVVIREISAQGRSRAFAGGRSAPVSLLADIGQELIALHGQADQWRLRSGEFHRLVVDDHGGPALIALRDEVAAAVDRRDRLAAELETLRGAIQQRSVEADGLRAGLLLLEQVDPRPGEDEALREAIKRQTHASDLRGAAARAVNHLSGDEDAGRGGALADLGDARAALEAAASFDPTLLPHLDRVREALAIATDVAVDLASYRDNVDLDPAQLDRDQERLATLTTLTRRYGPTVAEVIEWGRRAAARMTELDVSDERIQAVEQEHLATLDALARACVRLSAARRSSADDLARKIAEELNELAMPGASIEIQVQPDAITRHGADQVDIRLAANAGLEARSISRAASGGELARVMLAVELAGAQDRDDLATLVFDEVDAGVGGAAASAVGAKLGRLGDTRQVLVVTHLAQVAAYAGQHLVIAKSRGAGVTMSDVRPVTGEERVREIARMLAGEQSTTALQHAQELLDRSR